MQLALGVTLPADYSHKMANKAQSSFAFMPVILLGLVALVGLAGFGGWLATGDDLFMALIQTGMRWCL